MRRCICVLVAIFASALAAAGCGGPKAPDAKYQIVVIPKGLTHEHWQSIHRGSLRAAQDLKDQKGIAVEIIWDGPRQEDDAQAQISIMDRAIGRKVSGIVLAPQHSESMVTPVERAVKEGIPVAILDSGLAREDLIVKYVATDNYNGGRIAGQHFLKVLEQQGKPAPKIVLFRYQPGSESTEQREKGFEEVIDARIEEQKKAGKPAIVWKSRDQHSGPTIDSAERKVSPLISNNRDDIDAIFACNESATNGTLNALRNLGLNKKIRLVGFDFSEPLRQAIEEGNVDGTVVQDPYRMGYLGVWCVVQHLEGYDVGVGGKTLSTGEYLITRDQHDPAHNVYKLGSDEATGLYDPAYQAKRTIKPPEFPKKK